MSSLRSLSFAIFFLGAFSQSVAEHLPPSRFPTKKFATVAGRQMAYVEEGTGDPIVFLHGNPTSSFVWRNVMPVLEGRGRLIAPDLIGMGDSEKLPPGDPLRYSFLTHTNFVDELLVQLGVKENVTLVSHDWGSQLAFHWAFKNRFSPSAVKGIVFMETFIGVIPSLEDSPDPQFENFVRLMRSPAAEELVLQKNFFIEQILPGGVLRNLTQKEHDEYRRPFLTPGEDRRVLLTWPRQIPLGGEPAGVAKELSSYTGWLRTSSVPKLFIRGEPGSVVTELGAKYAQSWPNVKELSITGRGILQEDSPGEVGKAIADWLSSLR